MFEKEKPEIELYLYSMNQEFPVETGHYTFLKSDSDLLQDNDGNLLEKKALGSQTLKTEKIQPYWSAQWVHNKWIENYVKIASFNNAKQNSLQHLIMRTEDFGGIVLDPVNDRVYKVNTAGYNLLKSIIEEFNINGAKGLSKFITDETNHFIYFLKGANLWPA